MSKENAYEREDTMIIRNAYPDDINAITEVEKRCFPEAEAATREEFEKRLKHYGNHFWLMFDEGRLVAFVDGMVTDRLDLTDEMYEKADMHQEDGAWQMIFGVNTIPECRKQGYAGMLIEKVIADAKEQGRKGLVLTCKDELVHYYAKFGFKNEGISESVHGNVVWNQMRLTFVYEFLAIIESVPDKGGAYVRFPYDIKKEFGKGRVKVKVTFDGEPYCGSIVNMGVKNDDGSVCYIIGVRKDIRNKIRKQPGDTVFVTVKKAS